MIALFILVAIIMIKYKPVYEVYLNGEKIGYVKSKKIWKILLIQSF